MAIETGAPEEPINQSVHEEHERSEDEEGVAEELESPALAPVAENSDTQNSANKTPEPEADNQGVDLVDRALNALAQTSADRMDVIAPAPVVVEADEKIEEELITAEKPQPFWPRVALKTRHLFGLLGRDKNRRNV